MILPSPSELLKTWRQPPRMINTVTPAIVIFFSCPHCLIAFDPQLRINYIRPGIICFGGMRIAMRISRVSPVPLNSLCRIARENNSVWENKRIPQTAISPAALKSVWTLTRNCILLEPELLDCEDTSISRTYQSRALKKKIWRLIIILFRLSH